MVETASETLDAAIVGAGWAGLSVSYELARASVRHAVFEKGRIGETWRTQRWRTFRMNTPNALTVLPGDSYRGADPDGLMTGGEFLAMIEDYADRNKLPVREDTPVIRARRVADGFELETNQGKIGAASLVVATGNLNIPVRPAIAAKIPAAIRQMDGADYRCPEGLPEGAVLVVGCGDTGGQVAHELAQAGRRVFLSTGRNGWVPRRYRGRDFFLWMAESGLNRRPRRPGSSRALIGRSGTLNLHTLGSEGVIMLGRVRDVSAGGRLLIDDTLSESLAFGDQLSGEVKSAIDAYIEREGIDAPPAEPDPGERVSPRFPDPPISGLDLVAEGVKTVIWATGFRGDFGWLEVPGALDTTGQPVQEHSVSVPGVYFAGMDSPEAQRSGTVLVAGFEARRIARHLTGGTGP